MGMMKEFKEFAMRGNLIDMAVGVVIGGAFGKVVSAFIDGMVMPLIGKISGGVDFSNAYISLSEKVDVAKAAAAATNTPFSLADAKTHGPVFAWGNFVTVVIDFLIVAFVVFMVIRTMNKMKKKQEEAPAAPAAPPAPSKEEILLTEIRDALVKRNG